MNKHLSVNAFKAMTFDYGIIDDKDVVADAQAAAARIRRHQKAAVIDIGRELVAMKERLGHGHFIPWVEQELAFSIRTAQDMMNVARRFGDEAKYAMVAHLPPKLLYALAADSTPEEVRTAALAVEPGKQIDVWDLRRTIDQAKANRDQARARAATREAKTVEAKAEMEKKLQKEAARSESIKTKAFDLAKRMFDAGMAEHFDSFTVGQFLMLKQRVQTEIIARFEAGEQFDVRDEVRIGNGGGVVRDTRHEEAYAVQSELARLGWAVVHDMIIEAIGDRMSAIVDAAKGLKELRAPSLRHLLDGWSVTSSPD